MNTQRQLQLQVVRNHIYRKRFMVPPIETDINPDRYRAMVRHVETGTFVEREDIREQWKQWRYD